MPGNGDSSQQATCYPKKPQYEQWKEWADEMGYNGVSGFMIAMIETGYKQMNVSVGYDEETKELREQRNDLKRQLDQARRRIKELEEQLYRSERRSIIEFIDRQSEPVSFAEIVQHIVDDTPARVAQHLDGMEGGSVELVEDGYLTKETNDDN